MSQMPPRFDLKKARGFGARTSSALVAVHTWYNEKERKIHEAAKRRGLLGNERQRAQEAEDYKKWQAAADSIWLKNPNLSVNDVAGKVAQRTGAKQETVRKHIKKPEATH